MPWLQSLHVALDAVPRWFWLAVSVVPDIVLFAFDLWRVSGVATAGQ